MLRLSLLFAGLWLSVAPALAQDRAALQGLLAAAAEGDTAAVLHVITPEGTFTLTHGRKWRGGPPVEADDLFVLASVSKPYLAAAVLSLAAEGRLATDQPVRRLLGKQTGRGIPGLGRITLTHLLSMRSGLVDYYTDDYLDDLILPRRGDVTLNRALDFARGERLQFTPGRRFDYVNTNYLLAQDALERTAGAPMHAVFQNQLFAPAGLNRTFVLNAPDSPPPSVAGYEDLLGNGAIDVRPFYHAPGFGDGGLIASAADTARFFHALLIDRTILPTAQLKDMLADPEGDEYGLGIDVIQEDGLGLVYGHSGGDLGFVSDVRVVPSRRVVVVALFGSAGADSDVTWRMLDLLLQ